MTALTHHTNEKTAGLADQAQHLTDVPDWLASLRSEGLQQFTTTGFPTTKHEEWRFTNVAPIADAAFVLPEDGVSGLTTADVARFAIPDLDALTIVFVNGRLAEHLSSELAEGGITITSLARAAEQHADLVREHLGKLADRKRDPFVALNEGFIEDGLFVHAQRNAVADKPVHVLYITTPGSQPGMAHPRNLIIAEQSSQVTVIEHCVSLADDDDVSLTNAVTEIHAADNAHVEHYLLEEEARGAYNISTLAMRQGRDSNVASHTVLLGGRLVRNNVHPILDGEGSVCLINGLYLPNRSQHMDNHMRVEHAKPHGDSRQFYKGVLADQSTAVFSGRIVVAEGAQKTDAKQTNANLLLTNEAQINTKPQLEIYADDVKCTHGATIGQLDEDAVFYLRSRGVPHETARAILTYSFAAEGLFRMKVDAVRSYVEKAIARKLPGGAALDQLL